MTKQQNKMFHGYLTGKPYPRDTHENQLSPSCHDSSHSSHVQYTLGSISKSFCHFYMTPVHIFRGRNYISCAHLQGERYSIGEMHIPRGRRNYVNKKTLFCFFLFMVVFLFALWCFELYLVSMFCCFHCIVFVCQKCIHPYAIVLY